MSRNVAININVKGSKRAVKSIDDLEGAVKELRKELKGLEVGSEEFNKLSGELKNAETQLKSLNNSFKGLRPQKQIDAFLKLGEGIAGSFAIATAAVTAFGSESEDVQKAQLAVQQALTASIGLRQLAEARLQVQIVATTLSQKAYNLAATAGNTITKAFFTTLAANPITAIITAVSALAVGIFALSKSMKSQITVQQQFNKALEEARKNSVAQELALTSLNEIIQDTTLSEQQRQLALNELATKLPELNGLTLDQEDALKKVNGAIQRNIKLIQDRAKAEVLSQIITEKTRELFDSQNSSIEENITLYDKVKNAILFGFNPVGAQIQNTLDGVNNRFQTQNRIQRELEDITTRYTKVLNDLLKSEKENSDILDTINKNKERRNELISAEITLSDLRAQRLREELRLRETILSVSQVVAPTPQFIEELKTEFKELQDIIEKAFPATLQKRFEDIFNNSKESLDVFGATFLNLFPRLSQAFLDGSSEFETLYDEALDTLADKLRSREITKEAFDAGVEVLQNYRVLRDQVEKEPILFGELFDTKEFFDIVGEIKKLTGELTTEIVRFGTENNNIVLAANTQSNEILSEQEKRLKAFVDNVVREYIEIQTSQAEFPELQREVNEAIKNFGKESAVAVLAQQKLTDAQKEFAKEIENDVRTRVANITNLGNSIINTEEQVRRFLLDGLELRKQIAELEPEARVGQFIIESEEVIKQSGVELKERQRFLGLFKSSIEDLETFRLRSEEQIAKLIPQFEQLSADERLRIIKEYYEKLEEERNKNSEKDKASSKETFDSLADGLRQVSFVAQTGVQVFQQYLQTQLTLLQEQEKKALDGIVGNTEEAEKKRLEIQEEFENRKKQLTKRSQLLQLELTRVQAVANIAEAVTKALASGPLIGQILGGVAAALGAVQVGVVTSQIAQVRNLARGGLLQGATHERGGIPLGSGGVVAEGGEAVINRRGSIDYRGLLNEISISSGGAPMVSSSFDDTRLIEAINKQNREPIKAFVLEEDITRSQSVNKRLQQLSKI